MIRILACESVIFFRFCSQARLKQGIKNRERQDCQCLDSLQHAAYSLWARAWVSCTSTDSLIFETQDNVSESALGKYDILRISGPFLLISHKLIIILFASHIIEDWPFFFF